jgi:hypothetical protein
LQIVPPMEGQLPAVQYVLPQVPGPYAPPQQGAPAVYQQNFGTPAEVAPGPGYHAPPAGAHLQPPEYLGAPGPPVQGVPVYGSQGAQEPGPPGPSWGGGPQGVPPESGPRGSHPKWDPPGHDDSRPSSGGRDPGDRVPSSKLCAFFNTPKVCPLLLCVPSKSCVCVCQMSETDFLEQ